ncbi:Uncharacterised protein [Bordetella pertussis]|nr:Uncharacterised protein [Bordetella pertussis]
MRHEHLAAKTVLPRTGQAPRGLSRGNSRIAAAGRHRSCAAAR